MLQRLKTKIINDIIFKGKQHIKWNDVENYLKRYIGEFFEIAQTSDIVYIGKDFKEWTKIFNGASKNSIAFIGSDTAYNKLSAPAGIIKRFSNIKEV